jgi:DNA topoisomerase VI subunit A
MTKDIQGKIKKLAQDLVKDIKAKKNPAMAVPIRSLSNVYFDPVDKILKMKASASSRKFYNVNHVRKFVQTLAVANESRKLLDLGINTNLRDLYYMVKRNIPGTKLNVVEDQPESDKALEDLEAITGIPRELLHITADRAGMVAGNVVIEDQGDTIDWSKLGSGGWAIPSNVEHITFKKVNAKYVLYMEKSAVWGRLHEDKWWKKDNCIIIASRGQAPRGVRRLLIRLSEEHNLPIIVLTDFDPWGFYIYSVLKYGSINLANQSETLAVKKAKFMGITADDIEKYGLKKHFIKLKDTDYARITQLENYDWFKGHKLWQRQFKMMKAFKAKAEIQALSGRGIQFITKTYLPEKMKNKEWIE